MNKPISILLVVLGVIAGLAGCLFLFFYLTFPGHSQIPSSATVIELRDYLVNGSSSEQGQAAVRLNKLGNSAQPAIPDIIFVLTHNRVCDRDLRAFLVETLGVIGTGREDVMEFLLELPTDKYEFFAVPKALIKIGTPPEKAVPVLIEALSAPFANNREEAAEILGKYNDSQASLPLAKVACQDDSLYVRVVALSALRKIGDKARVTIPIITQLLEGDEDILKTAAAETIEVIVGESFANEAVRMNRSRNDKEPTVVTRARSWYEKNKMSFQIDEEKSRLYEVKPVLDSETTSKFSTRMLKERFKLESGGP
jgi:HEAT repeat protein